MLRKASQVRVSLSLSLSLSLTLTLSLSLGRVLTAVELRSLALLAYFRTPSACSRYPTTVNGRISSGHSLAQWLPPTSPSAAAPASFTVQRSLIDQVGHTACSLSHSFPYTKLTSLRLRADSVCNSLVRRPHRVHSQQTAKQPSDGRAQRIPGRTGD